MNKKNQFLAGLNSTQPITKWKIRTQTQPNPTNGLTQPMSISGINRALELLALNQHTRREVSGFTDSKDITGATKFNKGSRDLDHASFRGHLSSKG